MVLLFIHMIFLVVYEVINGIHYVVKKHQIQYIINHFDNKHFSFFFYLNSLI